MTNNRIRKIWNDALPLSDAWIEFASTQEREDLKILPTAIEEIESQLNKTSELTNLFGALTGGVNANAKRIKFTDELKEKLLDKLFNSDLWAFGYRLNPSESRAPVRIDPIFFEYPKIEWEENIAEFNGKRFRLIRITDPKELTDSQKLKTGRPTSGPAINAAINSLMKSNLEFCNLARSIACEKIRISIGQQSKRGNGLSDKNLEKYIFKHCGHRRILS